MYRTIILYTM